MRDELVSVGGDETAWDEAVALEPGEAEAIRLDPEADEFAPDALFGPVLDEEQEQELDVEETDPDFDDDDEIRMLQDLGIDLDAPDDLGPSPERFDLELVMGPEESEEVADDVAA